VAKRTAAAASATRPATPRGLSVHIGLNGVDPTHYAGWDGELVACESDANDMAALAKSQHIKPIILLTKRATRDNVLKAIRDAAKKLKAGDLFMLSYSGHGGQVPDVSGDEADKKDETWCFYDGEFIDDELYNELGGFASGVRIVVLSDSCHSGTVTRARVPETVAGLGRSKMMPPSVAMRTYSLHKNFYDNIQKDVARQARKSRGASIDPDAALAQVHSGATNRLTQIATTTAAA